MIIQAAGLHYTIQLPIVENFVLSIRIKISSVFNLSRNSMD